MSDTILNECGCGCGDKIKSHVTIDDLHVEEQTDNITDDDHEVTEFGHFDNSCSRQNEDHDVTEFKFHEEGWE